MKETTQAKKRSKKENIGIYMHGWVWQWLDGYEAHINCKGLSDWKLNKIASNIWSVWPR